MNIKPQKIGDVPTVFVYQHDLIAAAEVGTILFFHGLGASKDLQIHDLERLAADGFLVVGVDNVGHGERRYPDFEQRFSGKNAETTFQQAVCETAREVPAIVDALQSTIVAGKLGITGISMGGFITYCSVLEEKRCRAAVSILGSPYWGENEWSPHLYIDQFFPIPICSLNAAQDQNVPPQHAREFHKKLHKYYEEQPHKSHYCEYPQSGHFMLAHEWDELWKEMVTWFQRWL